MWNLEEKANDAVTVETEEFTFTYPNVFILENETVSKQIEFLKTHLAALIKTK